MTDPSYVGTELELFHRAVKWKAYFRSKLAPYLRGDVLEVGAGIGGTTRILCDGQQASWVCLEPDAALAAQLTSSIAGESLGIEPEVVVGQLEDLATERRFDAIVYIDVLEHIEHDRAELARAQKFLSPDGVILVLSPAFQFLFSEFDRSVGHHRRYDRRSFREAIPEELETERIFYLDSIGMLTSLANRFMLRQGAPTEAQIRLWDRLIVPLSRLADPLIGYSFGRSLLAILRNSKGDG